MKITAGRFINRFSNKYQHANYQWIHREWFERAIKLSGCSCKNKFVTKFCHLGHFPQEPDIFKNSALSLSFYYIEVEKTNSDSEY